jgi:antitoxin VapB
MKTAKIFKNGKSLAVRLPKEFRMQGEKVYINKIGNTVMLIPIQSNWQALIDSLDLFSQDFMSDRTQLPLESWGEMFK